VAGRQLRTAFDVIASRHHGHADAVVRAMKRLKLDKVLGAKPSRERQLVLPPRLASPRPRLPSSSSAGIRFCIIALSDTMHTHSPLRTQVAVRESMIA